MTITTPPAPADHSAPASRHPAYPAYKPSGVEWLGEIPEHWEFWKISHAFARIGSGTTPPTGNEEYYDGDVPWVNTGELKDCFIMDTVKKITTKALNDFTALQLYPPGTLLIALYGASIGNLAILDIEATTNQACCALTDPIFIDVRFLFYWLIGYRPFLILQASGGGQPNISQEIVKSLRIAAPDLAEQQAIAAFLDRETTRLDALIAKKEQLIALLQEKRTALISKAVTRGLDPTVSTKDSGVEWLGEIPEHWEVKRLKLLAQVRTGVAKGRDLTDRETLEVPYLRVANVQNGYLDLSDVATITIATDELQAYSLQAGDVLMNEGGDNDKLGRGAVWQGQIEPCIHQNHVFAVRPFQKKDSNWISLVTQVEYARFYFMLKAKQSTNLASISSSNLKELPVVLPPATERLLIMEYLDRETARLDRLVDKVKEGVEKLKEYRAALIGAAVTGKIDVRGAV